MASLLIINTLRGDEKGWKKGNYYLIDFAQAKDMRWQLEQLLTSTRSGCEYNTGTLNQQKKKHRMLGQVHDWCTGSLSGRGHVRPWPKSGLLWLKVWTEIGPKKYVFLQPVLKIPVTLFTTKHPHWSVRHPRKTHQICLTFNICPKNAFSFNPYAKRWEQSKKHQFELLCLFEGSSRDKNRWKSNNLIKVTISPLLIYWWLRHKISKF